MARGNRPVNRGMIITICLNIRVLLNERMKLSNFASNFIGEYSNCGYIRLITVFSARPHKVLCLSGAVSWLPGVIAPERTLKFAPCMCIGGNWSPKKNTDCQRELLSITWGRTGLTGIQTWYIRGDIRYRSPLSTASLWQQHTAI
jgi:hypothetical protein